MSGKTTSGALIPRGLDQGDSFPAAELPDLEDLLFFKRPLALVCEVCKAKGKYAVGTVVLDPRSIEKKTFEHVGFTGYFRCKKCNAGGPWSFPPQTQAYLAAFLLAVVAYLDEVGDMEDLPLVIGRSSTFDKFTFRFATEGEAHLKELIEKEPARAFLWVRLGNLYAQGGAPELAEAAYRRALELDPDDVEAHFNFGELLCDDYRELEAVPHWHAVLRNIRNAKEFDPERRWGLVRTSIEALLATYEENDGGFEIFPTPSQTDGKAVERLGEVQIRSFDLSSGRGLDELCSCFVDPPRQSWRDVFGVGRMRPAPPSETIPASIIRRPIVGRNEPCSCGSGKKYKKCCGK